MRKVPCPLCEKEFQEFEEWKHHIELEHQGMSRELLQKATDAHQTKKELGEYVGTDKEGNAFECPHCFEMFVSLEKLQEHSKKEHNKFIDPIFLKKLQEMPHFNKDIPPQCEKCSLYFLGLVIAKINGAVKKVCFNCYAIHYGENALTRLTIGTPDETIKKMREPINRA